MLDSVFDLVFFFNDTATTEIYTLSLHDALPILVRATKLPPRAHAGRSTGTVLGQRQPAPRDRVRNLGLGSPQRSEEHTSELQSRQYLVCRLLLEKKKKHIIERHKHIEHTEHAQI